MGNYSVILSLGAAVVVAALVLAGMRSTSAADEVTNDYTYKVLAREGSATGLGLVVGKLARDTSSWADDPSIYGINNVAYGSTEFTVEVLANYAPTVRTGKCNIDTVDVVSTAVSSDRQHVIEATYVRTCRDAGGDPGATVAIASDQMFHINGESAVYSSDATQNANIHSNDVLYVDGEPEVEGYGTYVADAECGSCDGFQPNDDWNGSDPNVFQGDYIDIPEFVAADWWPRRTFAEGSVSLGGDVIDFTNYQGITGYGTADNPFIWYIQGDLQIDGDVRFLGHVMVVVEGHMHIESDVTLLTSVPAATEDPPPSTIDDPNKDEMREWIADYVTSDITVGIYVEGSKDDDPDEAGIHINSNAVIAGHLFANHKIHVNGDATIIGGMVTKDIMHFNGKNVTWYTGLNESVDIRGSDITLPEGIRMIAYAEW